MFKDHYLISILNLTEVDKFSKSFTFLRYLIYEL